MGSQEVKTIISSINNLRTWTWIRTNKTNFSDLTPCHRLINLEIINYKINHLHNDWTKCILSRTNNLEIIIKEIINMVMEDLSSKMDHLSGHKTSQNNGSRSTNKLNYLLISMDQIIPSSLEMDSKCSLISRIRISFGINRTKWINTDHKGISTAVLDQCQTLGVQTTGL